jgi:hypothetical protein
MKITISRALAQCTEPILSIMLDLKLAVELDKKDLLHIYLTLCDENFEIDSTMITEALRKEFILARNPSEPTSQAMFSRFLQESQLLVEFLNNQK